MLDNSKPASKAPQSRDIGGIFESHHWLQHPRLQGAHDQHAQGHCQGHQHLGAAHGHWDDCVQGGGECSLAEGILTTEKVRMCKSKFTVQKVPARHQFQPIKLELVHQAWANADKN